MRAATTRARCTSNGGNWGTQGDWQLAGDDECLVCLGRRSEQTPQTPADATRAKLQNAVAWGSKSQQQPFKSRKHAAADKRVGGRLQVRTRTDGDSDKQPKKKRTQQHSSQPLACLRLLPCIPAYLPISAPLHGRCQTAPPCLSHGLPAALAGSASTRARPVSCESRFATSPILFSLSLSSPRTGLTRLAQWQHEPARSRRRTLRHRDIPARPDRRLLGLFFVRHRVLAAPADGRAVRPDHDQPTTTDRGPLWLDDNGTAAAAAITTSANGGPVRDFDHHPAAAADDRRALWLLDYKHWWPVWEIGNNDNIDNGHGDRAVRPNQQAARHQSVVSGQTLSFLFFSSLRVRAVAS